MASSSHMGQRFQIIVAVILAMEVGLSSGSRCDSAEVPNDSRCTGCPPMYNGKLCASTTRYNDLTKASCGCGNSDPVPTDWWTITQFTAALNCKNLDPSNPLLSWCPERCGSCYELCTTGGTTQGVVTDGGVCRIFKVTNRCGDGFGEYPEWCSNELSWQECQNDPVRCQQSGSTNKFGYPAHFDLQDYHLQISNLSWDNVEVTFEPVSCDRWTGPSWDCFCPSIESNTTATQPPTTPPSSCEFWCASNPDPWSSKCSWPQCADCTACTDTMTTTVPAAATTTPSMTTTPAAATTTPSTCSSEGADCRATKCCSNPGHTCFEKNAWWASCKSTCVPGIDSNDLPEYQTPWSCLNLSAGEGTSTSAPAISTSTTAPPVCSSLGQDCRSTECCNDAGATCYKKNGWWAECKRNCTPGIDFDDAPAFRTPWECVALPQRGDSCTSGTKLDCRATTCCSDPSHSCYEKNQWWAECKQTCTPGIDLDDAPEFQTPWSCRNLGTGSGTTAEPPRACSSRRQDCRTTKCCTDTSLTCYMKNDWWAECKDNCTAGIDPDDAPEYRTQWSCSALNPGARLLREQEEGTVLV